MKFKKLTKKQMIQIVAPILVIILILAMFGIYHTIKISRPQPSAAEEQQTEVGLVSCEDLGCPEGSKYVGSSQSNVYHECSSSYAMTILPQNIICFYNATEAEQAGYRPAAK